MNEQHDMLDDVALYALGTLPPADAARVRAHIEQCAQCKAEYASLGPAVTALGTSAEVCSDLTTGTTVASPLLKARIMRQVRNEAAPPRPATPGNVAKAPSHLWPAYLVAAACFALALISTLFNLTLMQQLKSAQTQLAQTKTRSIELTHSLADERATLADLMDQSAKRYPVRDGEVVAVHDRLYLTMHGLPPLPSGKVYQAWTLPKGSKAMAPSRTFVPNAHGAAIVEIAASAAATSAVAVSVEPEGGSKSPTTKPVALTTLE